MKFTEFPEFSKKNYDKLQFFQTLSLSEVTKNTAEPNLCNHFNEDMHGGHFIITHGFSNVHVSHVELTKMGQVKV